MHSYSVLMPCHKETQFLYQAILSVLEDTPRSVIIYLVVNKNKQLHRKLLQIYKSNTRFKIVYAKNCNNLGDILNFGLRQIKEDYIFRMDSDDIWVPGRYLAQKSIAEKNSQIDVIAGAIEVINQSGEKLYTIKGGLNHEYFYDKLNYECVLAHPSILYNKKSIIKAGGYSSKLKASEDYDLWLRMRKNYLFAATPKVVLKYRIHKMSQSSRYSEIQTNETKHLIIRHYFSLLRSQNFFCDDYAHKFNTKMKCRIFFFIIIVERILLVILLGKKRYRDTRNSKLYNSLRTRISHASNR